jgi:ribosomal protein S12 methylthiotransferase accessory factor
MLTSRETLIKYHEFDRVFEDLVDIRYGLIRRIFQKQREAGRPNIFIYVAEACNTGVFTASSNFRITAGASRDPRRAITKAIGEAIERYCGAICWRDDLTLSSARDAPFRCAIPSDFALYAVSQFDDTSFPYVPFSKDTLIRWVEAKDTTRSDEIYLPASMVFVPYEPNRTQGERLINQPISTGLAAHTTFFDAALNGLMEVVERDAFTIVWQSGSAPPQIDRSVLSPELIELLHLLENGDRRINLLDLTVDTCIPTVLAVQTTDNPRVPCLVVAGAASYDARVAILKSLEELALTADYMQTLHETLPPFRSDDSFSNVIDQQSHLRFWCNHEHLRYATFLLNTNRTSERAFNVSWDEQDAQLNFDKAVSRIACLGHRVWTVDLSTEDVREVGLRVVRTVIPGFHPLAIGHRVRSLDGERLGRIPGLYYDHRGGSSNQSPHPYP